MTPFVHTFWSSPSYAAAVHTHTDAAHSGWQFPPDVFSAPILTLPDWYGPWPGINQAYWRSECGMGYSGAPIDATPVNVGVQLVAMSYDTSNPQVLCEIQYLCQPGKIYSQPYNRNVTAVLAPVFAAALPARNNAMQLGVRVMSEAGREGRVYSSRLVIAFAP